MHDTWPLGPLFHSGEVSPLRWIQGWPILPCKSIQSGQHRSQKGIIFTTVHLQNHCKDWHTNGFECVSSLSPGLKGKKEAWNNRVVRTFISLSDISFIFSVICFIFHFLKLLCTSFWIYLYIFNCFLMF